MDTRCGLASAARLPETSGMDNNAAIARPMMRRISISSGTHQSKAVFAQRQDLCDADLHRDRERDDCRALAGFTLDAVDGVQADVELDALRDQTFDTLPVGIFGAQ